MKIYYFDGAWSQNKTSGMLERVTDAIRVKVPNVEVRNSNWAADVFWAAGTFTSWNKGSADAVAWLENDLKTHNDDYIILAYSAGNKPAHEFLNKNKDNLDRCKAVGFVSDPFRPRGRGQVGLPLPGGWGMSGEDQTPIPKHAFWAVNPRDAITNCRPDSIFRTFADLSDGDPTMVLDDAMKTLQQNRFQLGYQLKEPPWNWFTSLGRRIDEARVDAEGYFGGEHTSAYVVPYRESDSLLVKLGNTISWHVRNS